MFMLFQVVFGDSTLMYECRHLKDGVVYKIWVKAVTHVGEGDSSMVVLQTPTARGNNDIFVNSNFISRAIQNYHPELERISDEKDGK